MRQQRRRLEGGGGGGTGVEIPSGSFSMLFKCVICGLAFQSKQTVRQHILRLHTLDNYAADSTNITHHPNLTTYGSDYKLKSRSQRHPLEKFRSREEEGSLKVSSSSSNNNKNTVKTLGNTTLQETRDSHFCPVCSAKCKSLKLAKVHCDGKNKCMECGATRINMRVHLHLHTGKRPFSCPKCAQKFLTSSNLNVHMYVHASKASAICKACNKSYRHLKNLKEHIALMHSDLYGKDTMNRSSLQAEAEDEKKEKKRDKKDGHYPYVCKHPNCTRKFKYQSGLAIHSRSHSRSPYRFNCYVCNRSFSQKIVLRRHLVGRHGTELKESVVARM
mmetsp:Transcript_7035/g.11099  ORF Transcript_7035/g.11099 Transcript_7035/m.11099 type:complete len:331 (+) Transcript_7035:86-1078(+)